MIAWLLVFKVKADAAPLILRPLFPIIQLFEPKKFAASITTTSSPTLGVAGNVMVTGLLEVFTKI